MEETSTTIPLHQPHSPNSQWIAPSLWKMRMILTRKCLISPQRKKPRPGKTISVTTMKLQAQISTFSIWTQNPSIYPKELMAQFQDRKSQAPANLNCRRSHPPKTPLRLPPQHSSLSKLPNKSAIQTQNRLKVSNLNSKQRSANSGNWMVLVSMVTLAPSPTEFMNWSRGQTCTRTTRLNSARGSIKICTAPMAHDASFCTMSHRPLLPQKQQTLPILVRRPSLHKVSLLIKRN